MNQRSLNCIDVVFETCDGTHWRFSRFYGEPAWGDQHLSRGCLRDLRARMDLPWIVIRYFNEIMYYHEKEGENLRPANMTQAFRDYLMDCDLHDMGFIGYKFTWRRGKIEKYWNELCELMSGEQCHQKK
jgi:hypothetical protein